MNDYIKELSDAMWGLTVLHISELQNKIDTARSTGKTVFLAGNGGSFLIAQHWALDLSKAAYVKTHMLGSNPGLLTAHANDNGYHQSLSLELLSCAKPGDMLICLSCSGRSPNIISCLGVASRLHLIPYLIAGRDCPVMSDVYDIRVPSSDYGIIEDTFSFLGHWLTRALK